MSGAENNSEDKWTFGMRVIPGAVPRASVRTTLTYRLHPRLTAGIEVNPRADDTGGKVSPLLNWLALPETERRPALILGQLHTLLKLGLPLAKTHVRVEQTVEIGCAA